MRVPILLIALLLTLPSASALWMASGSYEPDTKLDSDRFMFFEPSTSGTNVYFNGFTTDGIIGAGVNPNSGTTQSRLEPFGLNSYAAYLGQWVDCNQDNYVGIAEDAMEEYPSSVLSPAQAALCVDGGPHNADGWVTEFLWIGNDYGDSFDCCKSQQDPRMIVDDHVIVWGDTGLPDDAKAIGTGTCAIAVFPKGSMHTVGGLLQKADCNPAVATARLYNDVIVGGTVATVAGNPVVSPGADPNNNLGLGLDSPNNWQQSNHPIGGIKTFGDDTDPSNSIVHTQDCSQDPMNTATYDAIGKAQGDNRPASMQSGLGSSVYNLTIVGTPETFRQPGVSNPNPPQPGASSPGSWGGGNVPATYNAENEELLGDCNYENGHADFYGDAGEAQVTNANQPRGKTASDYMFNFSTQQRGNTPVVALNTTDFDHVDVGGDPTPIAPTRVGVFSNVPKATPNCFGLYLAGQGLCFHTFWNADNIILVGSRPTVGRVDTAAGTASPTTPVFRTFYASVASASGSVPGGIGVYGAVQCPQHAPGSQQTNGWECDPTQWYTNDDATHTSKTEPPADAPGTTPAITDHVARVGQTYNLRDIDCYDGQVVGGLPVFAGTGQLSTTDCGNA